MSAPFRIYDVVWAEPGVSLPTTVIINMSDHIVHSGPKDMDEKAMVYADDLEEYDAEEFWENHYMPTKTASEAWQRIWEEEVMRQLAKDFGVKVISYGGSVPSSLASKFGA